MGTSTWSRFLQHTEKHLKDKTFNPSPDKDTPFSRWAIEKNIIRRVFDAQIIKGEKPWYELALPSE
jgi:hypothetical protein